MKTIGHSTRAPLQQLPDHTRGEFDVVIQPGFSGVGYWREVWKYRELFYFMVWRDVLVRYKQTVIGIAWGIIRPLLTILVFTVVFGKIAALPSGGAPYPLLVLAAMLPWQFLSTAVSESSGALIGNAGMVSKIYFPRIIIPSTPVIVGLVDFAVSFSILVVMMAFYRIIPSWRVVILPACLLLAAITAMGAGYWFSALNVKYRDFRYVVPFMVQLGLYISPVGFSSDVIPDKWRLLYSMNPMVGVIDGFRWALLGSGTSLYLPGVLLSSIVALVLFLSGVSYFRRTERGFADLI